MLYFPSAHLGKDFSGAKFSSAYLPPELIHLEALDIYAAEKRKGQLAR